MFLYNVLGIDAKLQLTCKTMDRCPGQLTLN